LPWFHFQHQFHFFEKGLHRVAACLHRIIIRDIYFYLINTTPLLRSTPLPASVGSGGGTCDIKMALGCFSLYTLPTVD
jgi:hypothetical protein